MVRSWWRLHPPLLLLITACLLPASWSESYGAVRAEYRQFAPGSEHLRLPPLLLYSLQMTSAFVRRSYLRLTLESMR